MTIPNEPSEELIEKYCSRLDSNDAAMETAKSNFANSKKKIKQDKDDICDEMLADNIDVQEFLKAREQKKQEAKLNRYLESLDKEKQLVFQFYLDKMPEDDDSDEANTPPDPEDD